MPPIYRLRGKWLAEWHPPYLDVIVIAGVAYDDAGRLRHQLWDCKIEIEGPFGCCLRAKSMDVAFHPDSGEIDRVGRDKFR